MSKYIRIGKSYNTTFDEKEARLNAKQERLNKQIQELKKKLNLNTERG